MTQHTLLRFASLIIFTLAFTALAYAAPQRTFVSAQHGDDANTANNCSLRSRAETSMLRLAWSTRAARWWPWIPAAMA